MEALAELPAALPPLQPRQPAAPRVAEARRDARGGIPRVAEARLLRAPRRARAAHRGPYPAVEASARGVEGRWRGRRGAADDALQAGAGLRSLAGGAVAGAGGADPARSADRARRGRGP